MASFDIPLFACGLERPGGFNVGDQFWPRRLEAVGLTAQGHFLQRRDREEHEEAFCKFALPSG
jgi:hypothetical protein